MDYVRCEINYCFYFVLVFEVENRVVGNIFIGFFFDYEMLCVYILRGKIE